MAGFRMQNRLTAIAVAKVKSPGIYADGGGLSLIVTDQGARRWELRLSSNGRRRQLGLGVFPDVSLEEARQKAAEHRSAARQGMQLPTPRDEVRARNEAARSEAERSRVANFDDVFRMFWPTKKAQLGNGKHVKQWETTIFTYVSPTLGRRNVAEIKAGDIIEVLTPIWHTKPETARRVLQRLEAVFKFAIVSELRAKASPCVGVAEILGRRSRGNVEERHHAALPWREVPEFVRRLRARQGMASTRFGFEFLILTAARSGEVRLATWDEIDVECRVWTVPGERMKAGRTHRVPLSHRALRVLDEMRACRHNGALIFPGIHGQPLSDMVFSKALRDMGLGESATAHGFRSSFKDWASENKVDDLVSEAALAHVIPDKTKAAYLRTQFFDERVGVMQRWADFCCSASSV